MNNIKNFNEFTGTELEEIVYNQELNEGIMGGGIRGFFNKRAAGKIKAELSEEIELSKSIIEGIKQGLDSLNSDFDVLRKEFSEKNGDKKSENQKTLDSIMKIIDDSRKNTWDLNELIDEGEIDYAGFTANIGIASVAYFGILLTPFRATVIIHKGYNYFFNIVKNTIRKALVMLQLNFDQFENLIITKGFQSLDYLQDQDTSVKISEFYGKLQAKLFDEKTGMMKGKRGSEFAKQQMQLAKNQIDAMMKADKSRKLSDNAYNCLDQYNNTYTKSLETLRQYTQDDVQKHLDSIKTSMNKLAGQDVDLQTYAELVIAAAEEHAYKVSSSIYNKFAKMTEVFSLPNQKKLIDLIQASTKEQMDAAEKEANEKKESDNLKKIKEDSDKREKDGLEVFKSIGGIEIGDIDEETKKYDKSKIKNAKKWTYEKYNELDDEQKDKLETWLMSHPEVLKECNKTLQITINTPFNDTSYIDSLIDYVGPYIKEKKKKLKESYFLNFDQFVFESSAKSEYEMSDDDKKEFDEKFDELKLGEVNDSKDLLKLVFGDDYDGDDDVEITDETKAKLDYLIKKCEDTDELDNDVLNSLMDFKKNIDSDGTSKSKYYISFADLNDNQIDDLKELYENEEVSIVALKVIGEKVLNDKTFKKNSKVIVDIINKCIKSKKGNISYMTYLLLKKSIEKLDDLRNHDYVTIENNEKKSDE